MSAPVSDRPLAVELVTFTRRLGDAGVDLAADGALAAARSLTAVDTADHDRVRAALRASLLSRPGDEELFDRLFEVFWARVDGDPSRAYPDGIDGALPIEQSADSSLDAQDGDGTGEEIDDADDDAGERESTGAVGGAVGTDGASRATGEGALAQYSPSGRSDDVSADAVALREVDRIDAAVERFTAAVADLPGRRWTSASRGRRIDPRRALRRRVGSGAPLPLPRTSRRRTVAHGVVLVDVSRSVLDTVDRGFLLRFLHRIRATWRRARVFLFDTEIREISEALDEPSLADALGALEAARAAWGGGTRIGGALAALRRDHPDAVDRTTTAIVVSDGLERGVVDRLTDGMAWLAERAARVLWLNPLAVSPAYEPTCRGMAAALPSLDGFYGFADSSDLERIADELSRYGAERTLRGPNESSERTATEVTRQ